METNTQRLCLLDSQVSVDATPAVQRTVHTSLVMQESIPISRDVSMDALPRNDSDLQPVLRYNPTPEDCSMLHKNVQDKIQSCFSSTDISSLEDSFSCSFNEFCSSKDDDSWLIDLEGYEKYMPPDIKIGYYDVMVLYSEDDKKEALEFCQHLKSEIQLKRGESVKAVLYDCEELTSLAASKLQHLEMALERCTYVFIYMTKHFCEDKWMELSSEECLMKAIYDEEKRWCVVPVYTVPRRNAKFKIPMGLNSLKGINYYNNDQFYRNGVSRLIEDKQYQRLKNEKKHQDKQYEWLQKKKRELFTQKENRKRLEHMEKMKTQQHILEEQMRTDDLLNRDLNQQHPINDSEKYHYQPMHYSSSEPGLRNKFYNTPHSASSGNMTQDLYNMPYFQRPSIGNVDTIENVNPYKSMPSNAVSEKPPPYSSQHGQDSEIQSFRYNQVPPSYSSQMSSSHRYYNAIAAYQGEPSQEGQIESFRNNQHPVRQGTSQIDQQNPNWLPLPAQQMHNQTVNNPQQRQNASFFAETQELNQAGLCAQQLGLVEFLNNRHWADSNVQQTVNQTAVSTSALYSQGGGIPPQNTFRGSDNRIVDNRYSNHLSMEPESGGNKTPLNNSSLSADQLSQLRSTKEMEPSAEGISNLIPNLSEFDPDSEISNGMNSCTGNDSSGWKDDGIPDFRALSMDGLTSSFMESVCSQKTSVSQSQGSISIPINQLEENTSHSITTPDNKETCTAKSGTETVRKTNGDGEKNVIIHHHYHYYEKEKEDPKIINIYDAKTVQIGDSPTVIESKKLQNQSQSYKELPLQKEKTNVKIQSTSHDVARKEIDTYSSETSEALQVSDMSKQDNVQSSEANQHNSRQSEDFMSFNPRVSQELKHSPSNKKVEENEKEEQHSLRTKSNDLKTVMEDRKEKQISEAVKKNESSPLGTKSQVKPKPIATVPPSPSVVQISPFKNVVDNNNDETVLKTVGREQSDDTKLKTVHESRGRIVYETALKTVPESGARTVYDAQTESKEPILKISASQRTKNRTSPFKGGSQTDKSQYQSPIQQRSPNSASLDRSQIDKGFYQHSMRSTGPLLATAYPFAASALQFNEKFAGQHDPYGKDIPSQDELDEDSSTIPPISEGFVTNTQENKEEWTVLETDSLDVQQVSGMDPSNPRRRKKTSSSTSDDKSCTLS